MLTETDNRNLSIMESYYIDRIKALETEVTRQRSLIEKYNQVLIAVAKLFPEVISQ